MAGASAMNINRRKLEDWLARCKWLATTKLDDETRAGLERLTRTLEQDLKEDETRRRLGGAREERD